MLLLKKFLFPILAIMGALVTPAEADVKVFAAASLAEIMQRIGTVFTSETGVEIVVIPAGSSTLAQQIIAGAPADIFVSANRDWVTYIQQKADFGSEMRLFSNRLVVIAASRSEVDIYSLSELATVLGEARLAIGDPDHVPAGIYAKQALERAGIWAALKNRLAPTSNVRAALRLVVAGAAPLGIVYATDVVGSDVQIIHEVDPSLHQPITYVAAMAFEANTDVQDFFAFLQGDTSATIAADFGYAHLEGGQP